MFDARDKRVITREFSSEKNEQLTPTMETGDFMFLNFFESKKYIPVGTGLEVNRTVHIRYNDSTDMFRLPQADERSVTCDTRPTAAGMSGL